MLDFCIISKLYRIYMLCVAHYHMLVSNFGTTKLVQGLFSIFNLKSRRILKENWVKSGSKNRTYGFELYKSISFWLSERWSLRMIQEIEFFNVAEFLEDLQKFKPGNLKRKLIFKIFLDVNKDRQMKNRIYLNLLGNSKIQISYPQSG